MSNEAPVTPASPEPLVLARRVGAVTHLTLNRPRAINALSGEMFRLLAVALREVRDAVAVGQSVPGAIVIDGAGERGFCGGGDIKELSGKDAPRILALEYAVDNWVATAPVPVVAIMDRIAMGGGIGLGGHASHRVVTERSRLAMPEVRIGIAPDVGGHLLLARAPGRLGELLATTAGEMNAADAIALGFADYYVPSERLEALRDALVAGEDPTVACARFSAPVPGESAVRATADWWDPIADAALSENSVAGGSVGAIAAAAAARLIAALEASELAEARAVAATIRAMCPTSVAVTLAQLARTRAEGLDLAAVLTDDLRVLGRLAPMPNFTEGVRAQVIDKDRNPVWRPATIEQLDVGELNAILDLSYGPAESPLDFDPALPVAA
ncbi:enoyl-CoA hydratase/isomerase family protein [Leucobacter sp. 7(1)]|uniref:enoyl-CoA hydratase/isomerase family protein n=1 Tax=Leucobacter sp. 7(1) TaxID=1255613 RepID=UPI000B350985|nr:enoyl-CoA hydratase/isomerase family protein [Leucobacter sp. 7(1)]